jgi:hypothetical protein
MGDLLRQLLLAGLLAATLSACAVSAHAPGAAAVDPVPQRLIESGDDLHLVRQALRRTSGSLSQLRSRVQALRVQVDAVGSQPSSPSGSTTPIL